MDKRATSFEVGQMILRVTLLMLIAVIILGTSSVFYVHYIDVRDAEARIMNNKVVNCLYGEGLLDYDSLGEEDKKNILEYCGYSLKDSERFFVRVGILKEGILEDNLTSGDFGKLYVKEIYENQNVRFSNGLVSKYEPGYFSQEYYLRVLHLGEIISSKVIVEVLVSDEF